MGKEEKKERRNEEKKKRKEGRKAGGIFCVVAPLEHLARAVGVSGPPEVHPDLRTCRSRSVQDEGGHPRPVVISRKIFATSLEAAWVNAAAPFIG